jgi:putative ubiquitin-RnfH superfamily antitoxin RatB of RatAB toxin-antitoxin module
MAAEAPRADPVKTDLKSDLIRVEVIYALPDRSWSAALELPSGAIASEAVARSQFVISIPGFDAATLSYAIFGRAISATTVLRDGDRLELLRPLIADPKQARRRRAARRA